VKYADSDLRAIDAIYAAARLLGHTLASQRGKLQVSAA
jgi:hypothetical protein